MVPQGAADVFVKLEWFDSAGSNKDRIALVMIEEAERRGELQPGMTVVEYTGGGTGSTPAFVCAAKGYRFVVVSSDAFSLAKLRTMTALGAELTIEPSLAARSPLTSSPRIVAAATDLADQPGTYFTDQLRNSDCLVGCREIGREPVEQMDRPIDVLRGRRDRRAGDAGHRSTRGRRLERQGRHLRARIKRSALRGSARNASRPGHRDRRRTPSAGFGQLRRGATVAEADVG
ncbi:MAG: pyridoxal-phosphate dependent enzyme [Dermatophilaceae bacterium]